MNMLPNSPFELATFLVRSLGVVAEGQMRSWLASRHEGKDFDCYLETSICISRGIKEGVFIAYKDNGVTWIEWA